MTTWSRAPSLRAAVIAHEPARGKRYDPGLKSRLVELAQTRRKEGASWNQISMETGLCYETVRRWCMATKPTGAHAMVPVRVVSDRSEHAVVVTSPSGHRIEGLSLDEAVAVLRALG